MARAQKEANLAAMAAATEAYRDIRSNMTGTKLCAELEARTQQSALGFCFHLTTTTKTTTTKTTTATTTAITIKQQQQSLQHQ